MWIWIYDPAVTAVTADRLVYKYPSRATRITVTGLQVTCLVICATADQITRDNIKFMGVWRNVHMHVYV